MEYVTWNRKGEKKGRARSARPFPDFDVMCSKLHVPYRAGFSLVEILVVLAIVGIVTALVSGAFSKGVRLEALDKETALVVSLLDQAREETLSSKGAAAYGVHFESGKAALFVGPIYSASAASNVVESMNPIVDISSVNLSGGGSEVLFKRLTGETDQNGTVVLSLTGSSAQMKTITIYATGLAQTD